MRFTTPLVSDIRCPWLVIRSFDNPWSLTVSWCLEGFGIYTVRICNTEVAEDAEKPILSSATSAPSALMIVSA